MGLRILRCRVYALREGWGFRSGGAGVGGKPYEGGLAYMHQGRETIPVAPPSRDDVWSRLTVLPEFDEVAPNSTLDVFQHRTLHNPLKSIEVVTRELAIVFGKLLEQNHPNNNPSHNNSRHRGPGVAEFHEKSVSVPRAVKRRGVFRFAWRTPKNRSLPVSFGPIEPQMRCFSRR